MSVIDSWGIKGNCVDCGLPCRRRDCEYYHAGVLLECDKCGEQWVVAPGSDEADAETHYCENCCGEEDVELEE